jgi:tetratricopeptide (TPR) repeat protein
MMNAIPTFQDGLAHHQKGRLAEAERIYAAILQANPDHFDALHLLGVIRYQQGKPAEAVSLMLAALRKNPNATDALSNCGLALHAVNRLQEALALYDRALSIDPNHANSLTNLSHTLLELKRYPEAFACAERAAACNPSDVNAFNNLGCALHNLGRNHEALSALDKALLRDSGHIDALYNRASVLRALERIDEAAAIYERVLTLQPRHLKALNNFGNLLVELERNEAALAIFDRAVALAPDDPMTLNNRGIALQVLNRHDEALKCCERALAIDPAHADAHYNEGFIRLTLGDLRNGWPKYEFRFDKVEPMPPRRGFPQPLWGGESFRGRRLLLHAEQGIGDTLQFVRYVPLIAHEGGEIILEVQRQLKTLLAPIEGVSSLVIRDEPLPAFDIQCPLLSLPRIFGTELGTIPSKVPYIEAPPERIEKWKRRVPDSGLRVGVGWAGNPQFKADRSRSIGLARLAPLFAQAGVQFISLHREVRPEHAGLLKSLPRITHFGEELEDFADTAAIVSQLDLVISSDTSIVHLAGAMGVPVWVLLKFSPDWRWMLNSEESPWYPTAKLYRQPSLGDWESVVERVREDLSRWVEIRTAPPTLPRSL